MKFSVASLAAAAGLASAAAVENNQVASPLTVSLTPMGNTLVKATITNTGSKGYNIFHKGTILDPKAPVDKLHISNKSSQPDFHGAKLRLATKNLHESSFTPLAAGESKHITIEMGELYALEHSGLYDVLGQGTFRYAEPGSTELVEDVIHYSTNRLSMDIDHKAASKILSAAKAARLSKRSTIQSDCTADQKSVVAQSEARCYDQATAASKAALSGSASKFQEYFKSTSSSDRKAVSDRYLAVAKECKNTPGGILDVYCTDVYGQCDDDTFAYTYSADNNVVWCNQYYTHPVETTQCHGDDKAGTTIHEYTHAANVYSPGTRDYAYGYTACSKLSRAQALANADTYEYYANAIHLGC